MKTQTILVACVCFLSSSVVSADTNQKRRRRQRFLRVENEKDVLANRLLKNGIMNVDETVGAERHLVKSTPTESKEETSVNFESEEFLRELGIYSESMSMSMPTMRKVEIGSKGSKNSKSAKKGTKGGKSTKK